MSRFRWHLLSWPVALRPCRPRAVERQLLPFVIKGPNDKASLVLH